MLRTFHSVLILPCTQLFQIIGTVLDRLLSLEGKYLLTSGVLNPSAILLLMGAKYGEKQLSFWRFTAEIELRILGM